VSSVGVWGNAFPSQGLIPGACGSCGHAGSGFSVNIPGILFTAQLTERLLLGPQEKELRRHVQGFFGTLRIGCYFVAYVCNLELAIHAECPARTGPWAEAREGDLPRHRSGGHWPSCFAHAASTPRSQFAKFVPPPPGDWHPSRVRIGPFSGVDHVARPSLHRSAQR